MIVVIGPVHIRQTDPEPQVAGLAASIAFAAAGSGARVELITRIGDDTPGDALLLGLTRGGVGHVAVLRDPAFSTDLRSAMGDTDPAPEADAERAPPRTNPTLDAADVGLAMRYLSDYRVIVVVHPPGPGIVAEAVAAAGWASAHLVIVTEPGSTEPGATAPEGLPADAVMLAADPDEDADGVGRLLGRYAAAVAAGQDPEATFAELTGQVAAES